MKCELELDETLSKKLSRMSTELHVSDEETIKKLINDNAWESREDIEHDTTEYAKLGEKAWLKVNLRDGQAFYGSIIAVQGEGKMKKIVLRNIFQELEYDIFLDLVANIKKPNEHDLGPDKEYFLQPRKMRKE